ncbi:MAG: hypothetical protein JWM11_62, partial [Planctomycetaceae bacterium]|nr:hypothetical protein [Planctomycetaceae bacterium]
MRDSQFLVRFRIHTFPFGMWGLSLLFTWLSWQYDEGLRHELIGLQLSAMSCSVGFSHKILVPAPERQRPGFPGTPVKEQSALPDIVENMGLATMVRRIERVTLRVKDKEVLSNACEQLKAVGQIKSLSFYETGISEEALADLLKHIRVKCLFVQSMKLGRDRIEWLNHTGLT